MSKSKLMSSADAMGKVRTALVLKCVGMLGGYINHVLQTEEEFAGLIPEFEEDFNKNVSITAFSMAALIANVEKYDGVLMSIEDTQLVILSKSEGDLPENLENLRQIINQVLSLEVESIIQDETKH